MSRVPQRILVVEATAGDARPLASMLAASDFAYEVTVATGEIDGRAALRSGEHQVALVPWRLGPLSGCDLLGSLAEVARSTPLVSILPPAEASTGLEVVEAGAIEFLVESEFDGGGLDRVLRFAHRHQEARRALSRTVERIEAFVTAIPDRILRCDPSGLVLDGSAGAVTEVVPPEAAEKVLRMLGEAIDGRTPVHGEYQATVDGNERDYEAHVVPVGSGEEVVVAIRETTPRKAAERALLQSQKMEAIGVLAAGIAHEINTPIQFIGDNVRFLEDASSETLAALSKLVDLTGRSGIGSWPAATVGEVRAMLDALDLEFLVEEIPAAVAQTLEGVSRVAEIVRAMKDYAHPGAAEATLVDLNHAVQSTVTVSRNEWKYSADLVLELDADLPQASVFAGPLNQVLLNLVMNAAQAIEEKQTEERGTITVATSFDDEWVTIKVKDTGSGIPPHLVDRVFEPFFTTKEVGVGSGQGLAIAHQVVVDRHGGVLEIESTSPAGTTVAIHLPRKRPLAA